MTDRINFLEKGKYVLTYRKMMIVIVAWFLFCFGLFLIQMGYKWFVQKSIENYQQALVQLNSKKESTMALIETTKVRNVQPEVKKLSEVFDHFPRWSQVLSVLSKTKPAQVWIASMATTHGSETSTSRRIEIDGNGQNASSIASFVGNLNSNPLFQNVVLNKSARAEGDKYGYTFILLGEVVFGKKEWN